MSSKVVCGVKLFSGSKVYDSVVPEHQVWFSTFDKISSTSKKLSNSPSSSLSSSLAISVTPRCIGSKNVSNESIVSQLNDENNNDGRTFNCNHSGSNCQACTQNATKDLPMMIGLPKDVVSSIINRSDKVTKQAVSTFKPESFFNYSLDDNQNCDNDVAVDYGDSDCRSQDRESCSEKACLPKKPKQHLYCNPFLEEEELDEYDIASATTADLNNWTTKGKLNKSLPLEESCVTSVGENYREGKMDNNNNNNNNNGKNIKKNESMYLLNRSYKHKNTTETEGTNKRIFGESDGCGHSVNDNKDEWKQDGSEQQSKAVPRSTSDESVKKPRKSSKDKIEKMVKQGARNYPAYLKLIYTGDSEHSSDDDFAAAKSGSRQKQLQQAKNNYKLSSDSARAVESPGQKQAKQSLSPATESQSATPKGIYDRISLFIDDEDEDEYDDDEGKVSPKSGNYLPITIKSTLKGVDENEVGEKLDNDDDDIKQCWKTGNRKVVDACNDCMMDETEACYKICRGFGPNPLGGLEGKKNDFVDNESDDDDDDNDNDDDDDDNETSCYGNDNTIDTNDGSQLSVEHPNRSKTYDDDDDDCGCCDDDNEEDDEEEEEDDDDDKEDGVLLKKRSTSLQMIKRGKFSGYMGGTVGDNDDDDCEEDEDDESNDELNRTDALHKGRRCPRSQSMNIGRDSRETEWMIELFRLEDDITSLKSVLDTKIRLAKEIKSRCFYDDVRGRGIWRKRIKSFKISDTFRRTNEALKSLSIFACAKIQGSRYMKANRESENEIFKVSGHHFSFD